MFFNVGLFSCLGDSEVLFGASDFGTSAFDTDRTAVAGADAVTTSAFYVACYS